jgi:hypothetical protein
MVVGLLLDLPDRAMRRNAAAAVQRLINSGR